MQMPISNTVRPLDPLMGQALSVQGIDNQLCIRYKLLIDVDVDSFS
jgi:hypothetical protein